MLTLSCLVVLLVDADATTSRFVLKEQQNAEGLVLPEGNERFDDAEEYLELEGAPVKDVTEGDGGYVVMAECAAWQGGKMVVGGGVGEW
ncbi:hypothetical protein RIF29_19972 [Crotalaria pallida]|uniref:Uncharacterized protein n=1 Tax=Crotalaria pallida TaxID=3830 RepID=A0AAN9F8R5_CROPI